MHTSRLRHNLTAALFLLPGMLVLFLWLVYPMLSALNISLRDWSIMPTQPSPFVGLQNYAHAFQDANFWLALKNTAVYALVTVVGQLLLGLVVALMLEEVTHGRVVLRTLYYLPVVTSWVVVSLLFKYLFNSSPAGLINYIFVHVIPLLPEPVSWLTEAGTAFVAIDALGIWKGVGFAMVIYLAALQSIPAELYQVAAIDGAGYFQRLGRITLPLIFPTTMMVIVMLTIGAFQAYIPVALITQGGPLHRTEFVISYMYAQAFQNLDFGYSSALAYILAAIVFGVSQAQLRFVKSSALSG
ncbi:MAG: sugar ABC transporter permease [Chloroflexi bacterium]|jgi:multiple sugar transport system permease protein|nr:sugar ABC transporter permease [Anaerolineaceae bacterium]NMB88279.1 sugar ABC transporter permease [Chloroflexota bacterium]